MAPGSQNEQRGVANLTLRVSVVGLCAVTLLSCAQIVGLEDRSSEGVTSAGTAGSASGSGGGGGAAGSAGTGGNNAGTGGSAGTGGAPTACESCTQTACSTDLANCANDPTCSSLLACLDACNLDDACEAGCTSTIRARTVAFGALLACRATSCTSQCELPCGGYPSISSDCAACFASVPTCCDAARACALDPTCTAFEGCHALCNADPVCFTRCNEQYVGVKSSLFLPVDSCLVGTCADACHAGESLACLGHVDAPVASQTTAVVHYSAQRSFDASPPVESLQGRACYAYDPDCLVGSVADFVIDTTGIVEITLPMNVIGQGFDGYLETEPTNTYPRHVFRIARIYDDLNNDNRLFLSTNLDRTLIGNAMGVTVDDARGSLVVISEDCDEHLAPFIDVSVDIADASTTQAWISKSNTFLTDKTQGKLSGRTVFANIPPGNATVTAVSSKTGAVMGVTTMPIRAGGITVFFAIPSPL